MDLDILVTIMRALDDHRYMVIGAAVPTDDSKVMPVPIAGSRLCDSMQEALSQRNELALALGRTVMKMGHTVAHLSLG
ncbi:MAG: hypothetical protein ACM3SO_17190 [Betaproteobacteria bacterium]